MELGSNTDEKALQRLEEIRSQVVNQSYTTNNNDVEPVEIISSSLDQHPRLLPDDSQTVYTTDRKASDSDLYGGAGMSDGIDSSYGHH